MAGQRKIIGNKEKEIIKLIAQGVLITASLAVPNLPLALKPFLKNRSKKTRFKQTLTRLEDKDLIILSGEKIKLSKRGKELSKKFLTEEIIINETKWDKTWKIVAYDIPDDFKKERDYFRKNLENLGFVQIQESLLAIPYECKEEIAIIAQNLRIAPFVMYMTTDHIPGRQKKLIRDFGLE